MLYQKSAKDYKFDPTQKSWVGPKVATQDQQPSAVSTQYLLTLCMHQEPTHTC